ncbi:MAG: PEP-CTERM sorting domain-containing protein [Candidatus Nitrotoga sp.]|nr:PEP-CTERM sorting domain-containing protein [Candidatus Nitrotoga sp.]
MKKLLMIAAFLCGIQNAVAAFIDSGTYLTDTVSSLDWLDVTASVSRSYTDVSGQVGAGGDFSGWRYATASEVGSLVFHWTGVTPPEFGSVSVPAKSIDGLVEALGSTLDAASLAQFGATWDARNGYAEGNGQDFTYGYVNDTVASTGNRYISSLVDDDRPSGGSGDYVWLTKYDSPDSGVIASVGSFLVRSTSVPEPATYTMMLAGLGLLSFSVRRRKQLAAA